MNIASIESFADWNVCIVRVRSDDGHEGYGQTAPFHANITALVLHQQVAASFIGKEVQHSSEIAQLAEQAIIDQYKFPWSYVCRAVSGVETALWDLFAKREGKTVCELLGGKPRPIDVYGSSMRRDILPQEEAERLKRHQQESGFRAFKIRIGSGWGQNKDVYTGRTEENVAAVRQALGEQTELFVDANSAYKPDKAIEVGRMLESYGVSH
jgi:L-alanine-DL-glutamate epimerase-like enolase superfamily enzyme